MSLVLDSSVALAWIYPAETTSAVLSVFEQVKRGGGWVPSLWRLEIMNVLQMGVRRRRHDEAFRDATLGDLTHIPLRVDPETDVHAWGATAMLCGRYGLTAYDAAYLELARRRALPLATLDLELRAAATAEGVPLLGVAV